jgi:Transcriptional regulators, similar to M. xanthus CarD
MSVESNEISFVVGQPVVYPQQGVGIVRGIQERSLRGQLCKFYDIYLQNSDMTILIPVDRAREIGLRNIVSDEEAMNAINSISGKYEQVSSDWKMRYQISQELLKEGSLRSIVHVVQALYQRSKVKELPIQERKLFETALNLLTDETSFATGKSKEEISRMIHSKLEK